MEAAGCRFHYLSRLMWIAEMRDAGYGMRDTGDDHRPHLASRIPLFLGLHLDFAFGFFFFLFEPLDILRSGFGALFGDALYGAEPRGGST